MAQVLCQSNFFLELADSFSVSTYLFFKRDERLGRKDVRVAGQDGKGKRKVGTGRWRIFVRPSLYAMRSRQNRLRSDWERVCRAGVGVNKQQQ